ncbi:NAD(P)-binding protein [Maledivibacter halophilus]|uniref:Dehydrogenase (Flavoprotein) n=1 Tax=Maledivibacter halophilus TaxID=36842 RepID=A0A1T5J4F7_9FIRM|nr:NAD(P)-binding protein [Maledivibacter halophilus]SKC46172.1 Dehydrogenase (flavoprotein) [Maledivibacter halophilus]
MKIAIIGAGLAGLSCAYECERLGIYPDVYERDRTVGWIWPSVIFWPSVFYREQGDIVEYLREKFNINISPSNIVKNFVMKSPNKEVKVNGELGYFLIRGKRVDSVESQLLQKLNRTRIQYNVSADYKELSKRYDYVVVCSGKIKEAMELGVWKPIDNVVMIGGVVLGNFNSDSSTVYFNTEYAGSGYGRVTPFSPSQAVVGLYIVGEKAKNEFNTERLFHKFLHHEKLNNVEFIYKIIPPRFPLGKVKKVQVENVLFAGRAAGLTDRVIGVGAPEAIISGLLAARAIICGESYSKMIKPLQRHIENICSFRKKMNQLSNDDFDRLLSLIDRPIVKRALYNSKINFVDIVGSIFKNIY